MNSHDKHQPDQPAQSQDHVVNNGPDESSANFDSGEVQNFNGPQQFAHAVQQCIVHSCEQGAVNLILCDADFSAWPLDDDRVVSSLRAWANSTSNQRMLTMVAATYAIVEEQHGMWVRWRKTWDHRVQCKQLSTLSSSDFPCIFWSQHCVLTLFEKKHYSGRVSFERQKIVQEKGRVNELIRQASPAFPASTLGL